MQPINMITHLLLRQETPCQLVWFDAWSGFCTAEDASLRFFATIQTKSFEGTFGIPSDRIPHCILARVLLNRLVPTIAEDPLPETQCGFRANRGTTDMESVLTAPREMHGAEQRTVCSVCGPDQSVWHSEQRVDNHGAPWLPPQSSLAWLSNSTKTSAAKLGWTVTSLDPSPSSTT